MKRLFAFSFVVLFAASAVRAQGRFNYAEQWKTIDRLMDGVLPQSALSEIEKLQQAALKDKAYGQLIKAVMKRSACLQLTEEKPQIAVINSLKKDAETVPFPAKAVIYSLTGEAYLDYYNRNRWKFYERSALPEGTESDDVETWDAVRLIREILHYYRLSLTDPVLLQKISIGDFKDALEGDAETRYLRPTLYDFLAHRALDAFMNNHLWMTDFSPERVVDHPSFFGDAPSFVQATIAATDTLAPTYLILNLFRELTAFRLTQKDLNPLMDVNLKRFEWLKQHGNFDDADALYEDAMKHLLESSVGQKIWGKAAFALAAHYRRQGEEWSGRDKRQRGRSLVNAVNLCREIEKHALLKEDRQLAAEMLKEITRPDANITVEKSLIPEKPALALVTYKNLHTAYLNIYRCRSDDLDEFYRSENGKDDAPRFLSRLEKAASHTFDLPLQTDYQQHSFETKIDTLSAGSYLLVMSDKPDPAKDKPAVLTFQTVQVTGVKALQRLREDNRVEIYAVSAQSGKPLQGAQVTVMQQIYDRERSKYDFITKDSLRTDSCGTVVFPFTESGWNNRIRVSYEGCELTENLLNIYARRGQAQNILRTAFFTDRAIYRPGQTIYFKGLLYETDNDGSYAIKPKSNSTVQLMDVNGREIARQEFVAGEYGSFNGSFTIPQGLLNGMMTIKNENGSVSFRVEEYKRPTFSITMNPITADYVLGDTITLTGTAEALAGYPVDGAKVEFNVMRHQFVRPLRWMIQPPQRSDRHIASGTLYTDHRGQFSVKFPAKAEDININDHSIYHYQVTIDVTDLNGETQSDRQEVKLGRVPLLVDFRLPEKIFMDKSSADSLQYLLKTANLNGNDAAADVRVQVWELKSPDRLLRDRLWQQPDTVVMQHGEFTALFPNEPYSGEDQPTTYEKTRLVAVLQAITPKDTKIDLGVLRDAPSGWYFIRLEATGGQNATVTDSALIRLQRSDAPIMNMQEWLTVVKAGGEPGDAAVFRVAGANDSSMVRYDVLFKNRVVERNRLTVGRVPQELRIPIAEEYRGGFAVAFAMVQNNREYTALQEINVPYANKELDIAFTTFRDRLLPGEKEKWTLTVKNKKGERETAEMAATLYDASLDKFVKHDWRTYFYPSRSHWQYGWNRRFAPLSSSRSLIVPDFRYLNRFYRHDYERLIQENWGGMRVKSRAASGFSEVVFNDAAVEEEASLSIRTEGALRSEDRAEYANDSSGNRDMDKPKEETVLSAIPLRTNFSETAFFYPELRTNEKGEISVEFTVPEALTRWNMLGFAHTKDFKTGGVTNSLITQKQVAISASLPRFFRSGDTLVLSAKVNNLTENDLNGNALLRLYDAFTMQPVDARMLKTNGVQPFAVKAGQSASVKWTLTVPDDLQAVTCRLSAQAGNHTDGEERSVPVLSNRILVTETMPFMIRGDQRRDLRFNRLAGHRSPTLQHHRVSLEYTSNPAWYAVQALPYLMDYPYDCAEQVFARFYANTLATTVANSSPRVKQIFDQWRNQSASSRGGGALLSNLEKNQDLKQALLEETPWVMQAASETERKKRVALLFDLNRMSNEQSAALDKLRAIQGGNGGFPWFAGMPEDRFVTQHIVAGLEYLRRLGALPRSEEINSLIERAMAYCDARIAEDYKNIRDREGSRPLSALGGGRTGERTGNRDNAGDGNRERERMLINRTQIHYLYACSFSRHYAADQQAFDFFMQQAERSWTRFNVYEQAMIALTMHRFGKPVVAQDILRSLKERAQMSDELGMYWADNRRGYFWNESPVETQAMLIQAFNEAGNDTRSVGEMKIWLLLNRQTHDWKTTKATSEAIYALLSTDDDLLGDRNLPPDIRIGGRPLKNMVKQSIRPEAGTGNIHVSWYGNEITTNLANLRITNPNSGIAWGAMYWQYYEDMDKISSAETNLQITKQLSIPLPLSQGGGRGTRPVLEPVTANNRPKVGDVVRVRLEIRADRDFEYVHLKDMRAAGFEPANTLSGYRSQGGLWYYESIRDASVNFFIPYLRRGTYVFEYDLRVANAGDFSSGITTIQCMYAPEFNAHSEGVRVRVE